MVDTDTLNKGVFTLHILQFVLHNMNITLLKENINLYNANFIRRPHVLFTLFIAGLPIIVIHNIVLCFSFVFRRFVMLHISQDCPFLIATSTFSNVYS